MQISSTSASSLGMPASAAFGLISRLAQAVLSLDSSPAGAAPGMMTPDRVRAALLEMGLAAADADVALAEALVQAGLPLTAASVMDAHGALARAPGASPEAYALAKTLALPISPDSLQALTAVLDAPGSDNPASGALPAKVRAWLGLGLEAGTAPDAQARQLSEMMRQVGRSTEYRLLAAAKDPEHGFPISDARTSLMRLAQSSGDRALRAGADGMAKLLEGQQLLNQAGQQPGESRAEMPLYFALPLGFDGKQTIAETCLWLPKKERPAEDTYADEPGETALRVTVRVAPPRLGRIQVDLTGLLSGSLSCRLGMEKPAAVRLLHRHAGLLAEALSGAGWSSCEVACRVQPEWPPLWPGGTAFTAPRASVDQHV